MAYRWRIQSKCCTEIVLNPNTPLFYIDHFKVINYTCSIISRWKDNSITGNFSGTCLFIKCASLFYSKYVVFHKLSKTYSFAYAKLYGFAYANVYTVHKTYSFAYAKYIVFQIYMVLHAATQLSTATEYITFSWLLWNIRLLNVSVAD